MKCEAAKEVEDMSTDRMAVCIPTYNRPDVIGEFLNTVIGRYFQRGFDVFVYDSGTDSETESVVREAMKRYEKLYYVRIDSSVHSNRKVYNIFKEFGKKQDYDYLWVCSDSIRWSNLVLDKVTKCMAAGYDLIIPNYRDVEQIGDKEYTDKQELFLDCAWHMTLYGATILKVSTMLTDVDWDMLSEKYLVPECINHSHVAFYFEKLNRMQGWRAMHLSLEKTNLVASGLKKFSGWQKETFYVWCHCWPTMIKKLPDEYAAHKAAVIKKSGVNSDILSDANMLQLREQGILDKEIYETYKNDWHGLTDVPQRRIWFLTKVPSRMIPYLDGGRRKHRIWENRLKRKIRRFCRRYDRVYLYGAGRKAQRYTGYLTSLGIEFAGYLVTDAAGMSPEMNGYPVQEWRKEIGEDKRIGILLALNPQNSEEALGSVLAQVDNKRIFQEKL